MSAYERTFATFELGDNVYQLSNELIPRIADGLEVSIADEPNQEDLQAIVTKFGTNKVLRANEEVTALSREQMADFVDESEVQLQMNRSLWSPLFQASPETVDAAVAVTAVANWQDRGLRILEGLDVPVYMAAGNRTMDTPTERPNPNVAMLEQAFGRYPTETEYAGAVVVPRLMDLGREVTTYTQNTGNGDELLRGLFRAAPNLAEKRLAVARVANAGVLMATQMRAAARTINPDFDRDPTDPQVFVVTDSLPVSRTEEQDHQSLRYQKAQNALRQVLLSAKKLDELGREVRQS